MPVIINDLTGVSQPGNEPALKDIESRLSELEFQVQAMHVVIRDLASYCQQLEDACRERMAECPGLSPFPHLPGR